MLPRAATSPELARLRLDNQWVELLACIPTPAVVYSARVNGAPASTDLLTQLTFDTATGTLADVLPGMTVLIGTSAGGSERGQARVRKAPTSSILYIGTESEISVADNDFLTVIDEFGFWQKRVKIDAGVITMDEDVVYAGQNVSRLPVVIMGGPVVLELNGALSVTAVFDASASWVPGGGAATYLWTAPGASATSGLTTATPTMTYTTAGRHRVSCTVTIGGVPNTRYEYVEVLDGSNPPTTQFQVRSLTGSKSQGGYSFQMTLFAQADQASVRDRAPVILFTRDHFGSATGAPGYATGRENIFCVGWIEGESIVWSPELASVTFTVSGSQAWLDKITAYPQGLSDVTTAPALWTEYQGVTVPALIWTLAIWRSTVAAVIDVYCEPSTTRVIEISAAATSLWEQLQVTAGQRLLAPPACDHLSRLFVLIDSQYRSDRSGVAEVMTLTRADWRPPIALNRVTVPPVSLVDLSGFSWDGVNATALFSLSPGRVWKRQGRAQSAQALWLTDQAQANTLAGLISGQANNEYPSVPIQLAANNRMLDFAPDCYVKLTLAAGDTPRGVAFTNRRFIPRSVTWNYDPASGGLLPTWTFEAETFADLAVTGDAPATEPVPPPPPPPITCPTGYHPDPLTGLCVTDAVPGVGDGNTVEAATKTHLARTRNWRSGPNWTNLTTITPDGNIVAWCKDPFDPVNIYLVLTDTTLYRLTNANTATPTWTVVMNTTLLNGDNIDDGFGGGFHCDSIAFECITGVIGQKNVFWLGWNSATNRAAGDRCGGVTWVILDPFTGALGFHLSIVTDIESGLASFVSIRRLVQDFTNTQNVYVLGWRHYAGLGGLYDDSAFHRVRADPGTFGILADTGNNPTDAYSQHVYDMDMAYPDSNLTTAMLGEGWSACISGDYGLTALCTSLGLSPSGAVPIDTGAGKRFLVNVATQDANDIVVATIPGDTEVNSRIFRTTNHGATWTRVFDGAVGNSSALCALGRWPYDPKIVYFLGDTGIYYTEDMFATAAVSKLGDWGSAVGAWAHPVMIIPDWLTS